MDEFATKKRDEILEERRQTCRFRFIHCRLERVKDIYYRDSIWFQGSKVPNELTLVTLRSCICMMAKI